MVRLGFKKVQICPTFDFRPPLEREPRQKQASESKIPPLLASLAPAGGKVARFGASRGERETEESLIQPELVAPF